MKKKSLDKYELLGYDEEEEKSRRKKRVKNLILLTLIGVTLVLAVVVVLVVVIVLVVVKVVCATDSIKIQDTVYPESAPEPSESIEIDASDDVDVRESDDVTKVEIVYTRFALSDAKMKMKIQDETISNGTLKITGNEDYSFNYEGLFYGSLCSGTRVDITIPTGSCKDLVIRSEYGNVRVDIKKLDSLKITAYYQVDLGNVHVEKDLEVESQWDDINLYNSSIGAGCFVKAKNLFGKIKLQDVRVTPRNTTWASIAIESKYGDVSMDNVDNTELTINSTFNAVVKVVYHEHNLGIPSIQFVLENDELSLKPVNAEASNEASSHHQISVKETRSAYGKVVFLNGTIVKQSGFEVNHKIHITNYMAGVDLVVTG